MFRGQEPKQNNQSVEITIDTVVLFLTLFFLDLHHHWLSLLLLMLCDSFNIDIVYWIGSTCRRLRVNDCAIFWLVRRNTVAALRSPTAKRRTESREKEEAARRRLIKQGRRMRTASELQEEEEQQQLPNAARRRKSSNGLGGGAAGVCHGQLAVILSFWIDDQ